MTEIELYYRLLDDLYMLNMPIDEVSLFIRPYSVTYYGRYFPRDSKLFIYPYDTPSNTTMYDYDTILENTIHEMVHHIQYKDPCFVRLKGVMHNPQFWKLYNHYIARARSYGLLESEVTTCEEICTVG